MPKKEITYIDLGSTKKIHIPLTQKQKQRLDQIIEEKGITQRKFVEESVQDRLDEKLVYLSEKGEAEVETPQTPPPCPFCAKISDTEIECGKDLKKGKKPIRMSLASCLACWKRREYIRGKLETKEEPSKKDEEEEGIDLSKLPKIPEPTIDKIADQIGVCENPILARQRHGGLACVLCKKRVPQKWQACQDIQKELKVSPIAYHKFIESMTQRVTEERKAGENPYWWWGAPKTEDMTLEEIEEELGLNQTSKDLPHELFDAIRKRYHEVCENCEEHLYQRCTNYCNEFWEGLPAEMRIEALKLKRYPSEEVTALREPLRERLKEIVSEAKE